MASVVKELRDVKTALCHNRKSLLQNLFKQPIAISNELFVSSIDLMNKCHVYNLFNIDEICSRGLVYMYCVLRKTRGVNMQNLVRYATK